MKTEAQFNAEWLKILFSHLTEKDILVGGQALAYWAGNYGLISFDAPVMTDDADLLAPFEAVSRLAGDLNAIAIYPPHKGFGTAIYGQIEIHINSKEYLNIDVLHKVYGVDSDGIRKRAIKKDNFYIINPIDLFLSKVTNYARLTLKQDENGKHQAELAIKIIYILRTVNLSVLIMVKI